MSDTTLASGAGLSPGTDVTSDDIAAAFPDMGEPTGADSSPAHPASAEPPPAEATLPPAPAAEGASPTDGPIPFERHKAVLENARKDAREAAEKELKQKYGWAERYDPQAVEQANRLYQWLQADPVQFRAFLDQQLQTMQPKVEEPPAPDLKAEDGTPVYSAPQMQKLLEWQRSQFEQQLDQRFQAEVKPMQQAHELARLDASAKATATSMLTDARQHWPRFGALEKTIKQIMVANPTVNLHEAYIAAFREEGVKQIEADIRAQYEGTLADKQAAATTKPGAPPSAPQRYKDMELRDIVAEVWAAHEHGSR